MEEVLLTSPQQKQIQTDLMFPEKIWTKMKDQKETDQKDQIQEKKIWTEIETTGTKNK